MRPARHGVGPTSVTNLIFPRIQRVRLLPLTRWTRVRWRGCCLGAPLLLLPLLATLHFPFVTKFCLPQRTEWERERESRRMRDFWRTCWVLLLLKRFYSSSSVVLTLHESPRIVRAVKSQPQPSTLCPWLDFVATGERSFGNRADAVLILDLCDWVIVLCRSWK